MQRFHLMNTVDIAARLFEQITTKLINCKNFLVRFWDGSCWGRVDTRSFTLF